jgi:hypothetical protein
MTVIDVLITRVHDAPELPLSGSSSMLREQAEQRWVVTAEGHQALIAHPFSEALDVALTWAGELGGEIYRRDRPGDDATLYKAAW